MAHDSQNIGADRGAEGYNFFEGFNSARHLLEGADLMYGNLETVLGGPTIPYKGFPLFTSPDSYAEGLKRAGFDVLQTINNHSNDQREGGLLRTLEVLAGFDIPAIGTFSSAEDASKPWVILEVQGFRMGFLAYTASTNGIDPPRGREYQVSMIDDEKMVREVQALRALGVDAIVVGLHWGREHAHEPHSSQLRIGRKLVEAGADVILGGHPHVLQPMELIETKARGETPGRSGFIHYSLGNFISNMPQDTTGLGIVLEVTLARPRTGGPARVAGVRYSPIWVHKYGRVLTAARRYFVRDLVRVNRLCDEGGELLKELRLSAEHCRQARWSIKHIEGFYGAKLRFGDDSVWSDPAEAWRRQWEAEQTTAPAPSGPRDSEPALLGDGMLRVLGGALPPSWSEPADELRRAGWDAGQEELPGIPVAPFAIDRLEVSGTDYARFLEASPDHVLPGQGAPSAHPLAWTSTSPPEGLESHPASLVTLEDARAFCAWRGGRLPTSSEWALAAGGTEGRVFPWGDHWQDGAANWFEERWASIPAPDGYERSAPVGSFTAGASAGGALDMSGNVEEWVERLDRDSESGGLLAGGSWFDREPFALRAHSLRPVGKGFRALTAGFRCARDLTPEE